MVQKVSARRTKLLQLRAYVDQIIAINEACGRLEAQMVAEGQTSAEIESTLNKLLAAGGPYNWTSAVYASADFTADGVVDLALDGDTISDRICNLLMQNVTGNNPIDFTADAEAD